MTRLIKLAIFTLSIAWGGWVGHEPEQGAEIVDISLPMTQAYAAAADYDTLIQESLDLRNRGLFTESEARLREALPLANETNEVALLLGMVIAFQERFIEASEIIDAALETYPDDVQLILAKSRVLSYQAFYSESIEMADRVLELDPNNLQAAALRARVFYYQRRYNDASTQFNEVLAQDPVNLDVLIGLYDAELAAGNEEEAEDALNRAALVAPLNIDVTTRRDRLLQPDTARHEISGSFVKSNLDLPGFQQWYDRSLEYRYSGNGGNQYFLRSEHAHRFGLHDSLVEVGGLFGARDRNFELAVAYTADSEILPEKRIRVGTNLLLLQASENVGATTLGINLTNATYQTGDVQWLQLNFTHYLLSANAWITPGVGMVKDELGKKTTSWNLGAHWQATARTLVGFNYTDAPETELNTTTQTTSRHAYLRVETSDNSSVRFDLSRIIRENSYTRDAIAVSLQLQF